MARLTLAGLELAVRTDGSSSVSWALVMLYMSSLPLEMSSKSYGMI